MLRLFIVLSMAICPNKLDSLIRIPNVLGSYYVGDNIPDRLPAINQYAGKTELAGNTFDYIVEEKDYGTVRYVLLENKNNTYLKNYPYNTLTGEEYRYARNPMPTLHVDKNLLNSIIYQVFSESEITKYTNDRSPLNMTFAVNSSTGRVLEIKFYLNYSNDDKRILEIPLTQIEKLEIALKEQMFFKLLPDAKEASYILAASGVFCVF